MTRPGPVVAVMGPTAVGKSALALDLAHRCGGEIVNADSMQLYRGMDIGTAKLAPMARQGVAHHLLDVWPVTRTASVADYQRMAREVLDRLLDRGVTPILTGGSGLYLRAALDDLRFPGTDAAVRARLEDELARTGPGVLHARLAAADPASATRIGPANGRRIVRALEVIALTGEPYSSTLPEYRSLYDVVHVGLDTDAATLDEAMRLRVDRMWAAGLLDEVRALAAAGLRDGVTASRALGYAQALAHLDGTLDEAAAKADTARATRRFARRQRSWFRRDPRIRWYDAATVDPGHLVKSIVARTIGR